MDNERLKTLLYNAIVLLEEGVNPETLENYEQEELLKELGMTEEEYGAIMGSEQEKENFKVDTSIGSLIVEPYDEDCAKGVQISVNENLVAVIDVTEDEEIRLVGYKEDRDEPSLLYSVNR